MFHSFAYKTNAFCVFLWFSRETVDVKTKNSLIPLSNNPQTDIERTDFSSMTCRDALKYIAKILHVTHEEGTDKPFALEMGWICEETGFKFQRVPQALTDACNTWAKARVQVIMC